MINTFDHYLWVEFCLWFDFYFGFIYFLADWLLCCDCSLSLICGFAIDFGFGFVILDVGFFVVCFEFALFVLLGVGVCWVELFL